MYCLFVFLYFRLSALIYRELILEEYFSCQGFRGLEVSIFISLGVEVSDQHGPSSEHHSAEYALIALSCIQLFLHPVVDTVWPSGKAISIPDRK